MRMAYEEQVHSGYDAPERFEKFADAAYSCPHCGKAMHPRCFGGGLYGFACNTCRTLMLAEADNCIDAAEKLGVLA